MSRVVVPPIVPVSKRRALGELIAFLRTETDMSRHNLADKTRTTTRDVERWERGDLVPTTQEWQRLRAILPRLTSGAYRGTFEAAAEEQKSIEDAKQRAEEVRASAAGKTDGELDAAVRMLIEAVPTLLRLTIVVEEDGAVSVDYSTREVKVVEVGGHLQVQVKR